MATRDRKTLDVRSRGQWHRWLEKNHRSASEIWLVFHKLHTKVKGIEYEDAIEEALCFGWIDSLVLRLDAGRYARKFTPRSPDSRWSTINLRRYASLKARGLLEAAGRERAPSRRIAVAPSRRTWSPLPPYIEKALAANPRALEFFTQLAPSYQRAYVGWIDSAKRDETKAKRLREAVALLARGEKLGLK